MAGDQTLFVRADEVEWAWRLYAPALDPPPSMVRPYPAGAWGPAGGGRLDGVAGPHFALSIDLWRKFLYYGGGRGG